MPVGMEHIRSAEMGEFDVNTPYSFGINFTTPITFDINFAEGTLTGTAPLANSPTDNITINTSFGADGVMSGTFSTDKAFRQTGGGVHTINKVNTHVIGLIGTEGLVGIMHGNIIRGTTVAGGFVASP